MTRRTIILVGGVVAILAGVLTAVSILSAPKKAEVVVPSGVSGFYGVSGNKLYYRVGRSLISRPVKGKGLEVVTNQFNTATISPDTTELFYRTMVNYVVNGYKLNLETGASSTFSKITDSVWCGLNLFLVYEQDPTAFVVKDAKGVTYFQNVPTSELYCLEDDLVYNASDSLATSEDSGTLVLKYLSKSKGDTKIEITSQESPLLQNNKQLSYLDANGRLILASASKTTMLPLRVRNAVTTQYSSGEMYVVDSPNTEQTSVDIYRIDLMSKNFAKVASFQTNANVNQNMSDLDTNVAYAYENYLYFMVGNSIVRVEL